MAGSINSQSNFGAFVGTTNVWDVAQLKDVNVNSPEFKELLVRLYQNVNDISILLNLKDTGYYDLQEFINGQLYFPNPNLDGSKDQKTAAYRQVFRKIINIGIPLPNNATITIPHNIEVGTTYTFTRIYGATTNSTATSFLPLPFVSTLLADMVALYVTNTDVLITTASDFTDYTTTYVVLEYLKS